MTRRFCTLSAMLLSAVAGAQTTIRLEIAHLPEYHQATSSIYLAGSFNGWNPRDSQYRFQQDQKGQYFLELKLANGRYEYKLTRGGWDKAECNQDGSGVANRILVVNDATTKKLNINGWSDKFPAASKKHTASPQVHIMATAFAMPQLQRSRRIWIYLPRNYSSEPASRYPVLYMHDGQNLFDDVTSYAGEWGVDEFLDSTKMRSCIVVGIDNSSKRMNEYNPYNAERYGEGEGDAYVDFIAKTLKPFVDSNYRTLPAPRQTFIAGSSMGGLISFYALLKYPDVFGGAGVFSPSFWIAPSIEAQIKKTGMIPGSGIYFYAGESESATMVSDMERIDRLVRSGSNAHTVVVIKPDAKHNESAWRNAFPDFYKWMSGIR